MEVFQSNRGRFIWLFFKVFLSCFHLTLCVHTQAHKIDYDFDLLTSSLPGCPHSPSSYLPTPTKQKNVLCCKSVSHQCGRFYYWTQFFTPPGTRGLYSAVGLTLEWDRCDSVLVPSLGLKMSCEFLLVLQYLFMQRTCCSKRRMKDTQSSTNLAKTNLEQPSKPAKSAEPLSQAQPRSASAQASELE